LEKVHLFPVVKGCVRIRMSDSDEKPPKAKKLKVENGDADKEGHKSSSPVKPKAEQTPRKKRT